jgi:hypothetical protein
MEAGLERTPGYCLRSGLIGDKRGLSVGCRLLAVGFSSLPPRGTALRLVAL